MWVSGLKQLGFILLHKVSKQGTVFKKTAVDSLIPTFGIYIVACWNKPKVGIKFYEQLFLNTAPFTFSSSNQSLHLL